MLIKKIEDKGFTPITIAITLESEEDVTALMTIIKTDVDTIIRESIYDTIRTTNDTTKQNNLRNHLITITGRIWTLLGGIPVYLDPTWRNTEPEIGPTLKVKG